MKSMVRFMDVPELLEMEISVLERTGGVEGYFKRVNELSN
jgi:hypothetical protein